MKCAGRVLLLVVASLAGTAWAETPAERALAIADDGIAAYEAEDYERALERFKRARATYAGDPILLYFLARTHEQLGHDDKALSLYEVYMDTGPDPANARQVRQALRRLRAQRVEEPASSPKEPPAKRAPRQPVESPPAGGPSLVPFYVAAAVVAAGGIGLWWGHSEWQAAGEDMAAANSERDRAGYDAARDRAGTARLAYYGSIGAGVLALGLGAYWFSVASDELAQAAVIPVSRDGAPGLVVRGGW